MSRSKLNEPDMKYDPALLQSLRKVIPDLIAQDIVGVQSMTSPLNKKWERIGIDGPTQTTVYSIRSHEIRTWIEDQPIHAWKFYDINDTRLDLSLASLGQNYVFTEEMEVWFTLRWS